MTDNEPYLEGTKVVLLLGQKDFQKGTLNEVRGYCYIGPDNIVYISSYEPQNALDRRLYLRTENEELEEEEEEEGKEKDHSKTRHQNYKFWLYYDIKKAINIINKGYQKPLPDKLDIHPHSEHIINVLNNYKSTDDVYLDIETNENFCLNCIGISSSTDIYIHVIPFIRYNNQLAYDCFPKILKSLQGVFNRGCNIVIHNALFDLYILAWRYRIIPPRNIFDTMTSWHRVVTPEAEKSLGHCLSVVSYGQYHKNEGVFSPKTLDQEIKLWNYNAKDISGLKLLKPWIVDHAKEHGLEKSLETVNKLSRPYLLLKLQGMKVDLDYKDKELEQTDRLKTQLRRIMKILVGYDICYNPKGDEVIGWQRISKYLYDLKGYPKPPPVYENGKPVYRNLTSSKMLYKLLLKFDIPFLKVILRYRHLGKKSGFLKFQTFTSPSLNLNKRFVYEPKISGTNTFRISTSKIFQTWGFNSQNIEKELRKVVIADNNKVLLQTDQSGAEALIVAHIAPFGNYRLLWNNNIKPYIYVAIHLFQTIWENKLGFKLNHLISSSVNELKEQDGFSEVSNLIRESDNWSPSQRYYFLAKMTALASSYDMKAPTFQLNVLDKSKGVVVLTRKQAEFFLIKFHSLFPEIHKWHFMVQAKLYKDRTLENLFGDRRIFNGFWGDELFRQAYAFVPQSTVGMLTNHVIIELQDLIEKEHIPIDILANGHDAILYQTIESYKLEAKKLVEGLFAKTFFKGMPNEFTMKSETTIGKDWSFKEKI